MKPEKIKTDSPAPNPRYSKIMPTGLARCSESAIFTVGNITIWKGTTIENTSAR